MSQGGADDGEIHSSQRHQRINKEKEDLNMEGILNPVN